MKKAMMAISVLFLSIVMMAQDGTQATQKKADDFIKFKEVKYDFGKIKVGVPVTHDFQFSNISSQPIVIEHAQASCGCTTPTWPQAAIAKGKTDKITAGFNAASLGVFSKSITVKVAGIDVPTQLTITGEVLNDEDFAKFQASKSNSKSNPKK